MQFSAIACVPRSGKVLLLWISSFLALRSHQNFCSSLILAYSNGQIHLGCIYLEQFGLWWQSVLSICWPECQCPAEQPEGVEFKRSQHQDDLTCFCFQQQAVSGSIGLYLEKGWLTFVALSLSQSSNLCFPPKFMKASVWLRTAKLWLSMLRQAVSPGLRGAAFDVFVGVKPFSYCSVSAHFPQDRLARCVKRFMSQWRFTFIKMPALIAILHHCL